MLQRRKLQSLQEEHSDLLELLAQQEVELSVFRKAVEDRFGSNEFQNFEELAHKNVVEMYGTYTNFRDNLAID